MKSEASEFIPETMTCLPALKERGNGAAPNVLCGARRRSFAHAPHPETQLRARASSGDTASRTRLVRRRRFAHAPHAGRSFAHAPRLGPVEQLRRGQRARGRAPGAAAAKCSPDRAHACAPPPPEARSARPSPTLPTPGRLQPDPLGRWPISSARNAGRMDAPGGASPEAASGQRGTGRADELPAPTALAGEA